MLEERMLYRRYKQHFSDCETLGDYDKSTKTITVIVPDGRMKPSGVRGRRFLTIWLNVDAGKGVWKQGFRAVDYEHAVAQAKRNGWTVHD